VGGGSKILIIFLEVLSEVSNIHKKKSPNTSPKFQLIFGLCQKKGVFENFLPKFAGVEKKKKWIFSFLIMTGHFCIGPMGVGSGNFRDPF
jgi:hypothetical protein